MKHSIGYTCTAAVAALTLMGGLALAEDKSAGADPTMEEMMKKAEAAGTPGEGHKALEPLIGTWTAEVKCWMSPDEPPTVSRGTAKTTWVMNGRYVQEEFKGEFMGKPFNGMSLTGYDNVKKKYTSVWIDDMSTSTVTSEGTAENGGKVITLEGTHVCPATGQTDMPMKQVVRILSNDRRVFEMHDPGKGEKSKVMEITYTSTSPRGGVAENKPRR
jgi:hypothetical protein